MSGLYQRAIEYLQSQRRLRLVRPDEEDDFQGTPEERAQIENEIRRVVDENRINVGPETFRIRPQKRGSGLPILVNVAALLLIAGGVYLLFQLFDAREQDLVTRTGTVLSAEGRLLSALREESAQALSRKDAEIAEIERRLAEARDEREQIRTEAQTRLASREAELRAEFEAALEAERTRLAGENLSEAERTTRLRAFRAEREDELEQSIAAIQDEARADVEAQEAALASLVADYERTLGEAQTERESLRTELAEREAELEARFEQQATELSNERAAAVELLEELEARQDERRLILDQILAFYAGARTSISDGDYEAAGASLDSLRDYLRNGPIASVPELQRRRQVELFLVETLEQRLASLSASSEQDTRTLVESAGLVAEVGELISQAEGSYEGGDVERARELYVAALSRIPAVRVGYDRLEQIETGIEATQSDRVAGLIETGNALYRDGQYEAAVERYGEALATLPAPADALLARLLDAGYQLRATDSLAELADLRDELAAQNAELAGARGTIATQREQLERREATIDEQAAALAERSQAAEDAAAEAAEQGTRVADLREQLRSVDDLLATERERVAELEERATAAEAAAPSVTPQASGPSDELVSAREELAAARESQAALEARVAQTEEELAAARDSAREAETELRTTRELIDALEARLAASSDELGQTSAELAATEDDLASARGQLAEAQDELQSSRADLAELRERRREQEALVDEIERYREAFAGGSARGRSEGGTNSLELLETKLLILRIVSSDAVRADYPDLYDQLNAFLDALVAEQRSEAIQSSVQEVAALIDEIADRSASSIGDIDALAEDYPALSSPGAAGSTEELLEKLRDMRR